MVEPFKALQSSNTDKILYEKLVREVNFMVELNKYVTDYVRIKEYILDQKLSKMTTVGQQIRQTTVAR